MVDDLNSLKIIGNAELQERPIEEVIYKKKMRDFDEMISDLSENDGSCY
jgi:hypothetical protein